MHGRWYLTADPVVGWVCPCWWFSSYGFLKESPGHPHFLCFRAVLAQSWSMQTDFCWWDQTGRWAPEAHSKRCSTGEPPKSQSKAQRHQAWWLLGICSLCRFAPAVLCSWLKRVEFGLRTSHPDLPWQEHTVLMRRCQPRFQNLSFLQKEKHLTYPQCFSDFSTLASKFRCFREEKGKRRGKCERSTSFSSTQFF